MLLTTEEMEYDLNEVRNSIQQCRKNKTEFNQIVHNPASSKEDVILFMKRVNMEDERINKLERVIEIREHLEKTET